MQIRQGSQLLNVKIKGNICFRNVSFKYQNREEYAIKDASFEIQEGEQINIVGPSGCGKSTILKLLLGFYTKEAGEILVDGVRIEHYSVHCLRDNFGTVSQEPELFDDSIEYNIAYNLTKSTKEEIYAAAVKAKLISPPTSNAKNPED